MGGRLTLFVCGSCLRALATTLLRQAFNVLFGTGDDISLAGLTLWLDNHNLTLNESETKDCPYISMAVPLSPQQALNVSLRFVMCRCCRLLAQDAPWCWRAPPARVDCLAFASMPLSWPLQTPLQQHSDD